MLLEGGVLARTFEIREEKGMPPNQEVVWLTSAASFASASGWAGWVFLISPHRLGWRLFCAGMVLFAGFFAVLCVVLAFSSWPPR